MNLPEPIGGYFDLGLSDRGEFPHQNALFLNSGRHGFEYLLRARQAKRVYLPKYTCDVMLEPLKKHNIPYVFYAITESLEIESIPGLVEGDILLYTNYFGVKDVYCNKLARTYGEQLILDCSQALYFVPEVSVDVFYSPRKFIGLPDGGCVVSDKHLQIDLAVDTTSWQRMSHLLKRIDQGPEAGYEDFKRNDASLSKEPLQAMSRLTKSLLLNADHTAIRTRRQANFTGLHKVLGANNRLSLNPDDTSGPLVYPYLVAEGSALRQKLLQERIFAAQYWPNVMEWADSGDTEALLTQNLLALPIDQRYNQSDMQRIVEVLAA